MFVGICNPDAVNIRNQRSAAEGKANFNPIKRIENAFTQSGRIANPPERPSAHLPICPFRPFRPSADQKPISV